MAIIKCKMCGGDLDISEGLSVCECEYCGTKQTVPSADNEKKLTLFARAGRLRAANEFDKAAGVYETIVADFPEEAEAYWGLVLCRYGIEYVDDPATGKKVPTCHRVSFDSVLEDGDFEQACENADAVARRQYREEAKLIEDIRRGIIEVSGKEEPYDIFICYKETDENGERTVDSVLAQDVYDALTERGYRVFFSRISLEDKLGTEYEPYIFAALNSAKIMLAFGTDFEYYNAVWVKNEWSRFLKLMEKDKGKHLIPCYKGIDAYDMPKEFQRLQGQDLSKVGAIQDLLRGIEKILPRPNQAKTPPAKTVENASATEPLLKRGQFALEDRDWQGASTAFDKVLDLDPENAEAYLGKLLAKYGLTSPGELRTLQLKIELPAADAEEIRVTGFDPSRKVQAIKTIREFTGMGLAEAKTFIENLPRTLKISEAGQKDLRNGGLIFTSSAGATAGGGASALRSSPEYRRFQRHADAARAAEIEAYLSEAEDASRKVAEKIRREAEERAERERREAEERAERERREAEERAERERREAEVRAERERREAEERAERERREAEVRAKKRAALATARARLRQYQGIIGAGYDYTVGLRSNGTLVYTDKVIYNTTSKPSIWSNITAISAGNWHTVALRSNGTVIAEGHNLYGEGATTDWKSITAIAAGSYHTVGLRTDGTVIATKLIEDQNTKDSGQSNVFGWQGIVAIDAGTRHTVGLRADGTVVATRYIESRYQPNNGQCNVSDWRDIVSIAAGGRHTVGLCSDGTVVAVGSNYHGQCGVSDWHDIVAIAAGENHTVGLQSDGRVVAVGENKNGQCNVSGWGNIVAVTAGVFHTVGLRADGTAISTTIIEDQYCKNAGQSNVSGWRLFDRIDVPTKDKENAAKSQPNRKQLTEEWARLQTELLHLKGLFSGKRRKEIEARLAEIEAELKKM